MKIVQDTALNVIDILEDFAEHPATRARVHEWIGNLASALIQQEVLDLAHVRSGLHFNLQNTESRQVEEFSLTDLATRFQNAAPVFWSIFSTVMTASTDSLGRKRQAFNVPATWQCPNGDGGDVIDPPELGDEDAYWKALGVDEESLGSELGEDGEDKM